MSDSVRNLKNAGSFGNLENLEEITLSKNITAITHSIFANNYNLKKVNIPNSVTIIEDNAFINCYLLEEIVMPEALQSIGNSAFENVGYVGRGGGMKKILLNEGLKIIGERAFANWHETKTDLILPSTISEIGESAFDSFGQNTGKKVYNSDGTEYKK